MIYLQSEERLFKQTRTTFEGAFRFILESMFRTFTEKGKVRDTGSPIHHRQSPHQQLGIAQAKCRRIESIMSDADWEGDPKALELLMEETCDAANYLGFIGALCSMLLEELSEVDKSVRRGIQGG